MIPDKILYTDGHDVVVTDTMLKVKNALYWLNGITKHGLSVVRPNRMPGFFIVLLGIIVGLTGLFQLIPSSIIPDIQIAGKMFSANVLALIVGGIFLLIGLILIGLVRERYAVRIATAEGEKDVIVSNKKEYISQIINALNEAFGFVRVNVSTYTK